MYSLRQALLAADPGDTLTIATNNPRHLLRFPGIECAALAVDHILIGNEADVPNGLV